MAFIITWGLYSILIIGGNLGDIRMVLHITSILLDMCGI